MTEERIWAEEGIWPVGKIQKYTCPKHGTQSAVGIQTRSESGVEINYCFECFDALLAANCCQLTKNEAEVAS